MDPQPTFGPRELLTHIIADVAKAVSNREGESPAQYRLRSLAATHAVLAFQPRDAIEAMLAGRCLVFHELIIDTARTTLSGEETTKRRATRSSIVAMDKAFGNNLASLEHFQNRQADAAQEAGQATSRTEADIADRVRRHQSATPPAAAGQPAQVLSFSSPEAIAACRANPEAMAALDAADPERFARAMGVDQPSTSYLAAAATQMADFPRQPTVAGSSTHPQAGAPAPYAGNRQARRHPNR